MAKFATVFPQVPTALRDWSRWLQGLFYTGEFTATLTGCTTSPTGTVYYTVSAGIASLTIPEITGTSNTTAATLTNLPKALWPEREFNDAIGRGVNNSVDGIVVYRPKSSGIIELYNGAGAAAFTGSNTKGTRVCCITYNLS